ncbi:MAG: hypothetical protein HQK96_09425, partial [Nitrospirae bacterium]|nr:hypothetical protein [Nitrospirota bacterium]
AKPESNMVANWIKLSKSNEEIIGARKLGKTLFLCPEDVLKHQVIFPILVPAVNYILKEHGKIDKLILIVTDQKDNRYNFGDTINSGKLIKKIFPGQFGNIKDIELLIVSHVNPYMADLAHEYFKKELPSHAPVNATGKFYPVISAGIPHLNAALHNVAFNLYGRKCYPIQVKQPPQEALRTGSGHGTVEPVSLTPFIRDMVIRMIKTHISRYDYMGAIGVIEEFGELPNAALVKNVLHYAEMRRNLNITEATKFLNAHSSDSTIKALLDEDKSPSLANLLKHMLSLLKIQARNKNIYGFVLNVGTFYENLLRYIAWDVTGIEELKDVSKQQFLSNTTSITGLDSKNGSILCTPKTYSKLIEDKIKQNKAASYKDSYGMLKKFSNVYKIRNKLLHQIAGINEQQLNNLCSNNDKRSIGISLNINQTASLVDFITSALEELLKAILKETSIPNLYNEINEFIYKTLEPDLSNEVKL